ncbi:MAG: hypothetical protein R3B07_29445 [Polyangiaceae bacterium]
MAKRRSSIPPEFPVNALRDHSADSEALDRVWQRLDEELPQRPAVPAQRRNTSLIWAAAAGVLLFGFGVLVGARVQPTAEVAPLPAAEPAPTDRAAGDEAPEPQPAISAEPAPESPAPAERRIAPIPHAPRAETSAVNEVSEAPVAVRPVGPPEWQKLADSGEYAAAYQAVQEQGGFDAVMAQSSAEQLMTLAEVARANRQRGRASQALRQLLARFPGDPNAPLAALALGNLLEAAGDKKGAAEAFGLYRSLSPDGDFAEDALARQVLAAIEQGNMELARKLAGQYEKDYPSGRRAQEIRDALAEAEASDAGAPEPEGADAGVESPAPEPAPSAAPAPQK